MKSLINSIKFNKGILNEANNLIQTCKREESKQNQAIFKQLKDTNNLKLSYL
jgi:hypothetical protein